MRLKVTLHRAGGSATDIVVTVDATATVADVADAVVRCDSRPSGVPSPDKPTLGVSRISGLVTLDRASGIGESVIVSVDHITTVPAPDRYRDGGAPVPPVPVAPLTRSSPTSMRG